METQTERAAMEATIAKGWDSIDTMQNFGNREYSYAAETVWNAAVKFGKEQEAREIAELDAEKIAEDLTEYFFTNGTGRKASRLILDLSGGGLSGCGWGKAPFKDHIKTALLERLKESEGK